MCVEFWTICPPAAQFPDVEEPTMVKVFEVVDEQLRRPAPAHNGLPMAC